MLSKLFQAAAALRFRKKCLLRHKIKKQDQSPYFNLD
jgi:hypothetical protein